MPELPEVETIRLGLSRLIVNKTIKRIELLSKSSFAGDSKKVVGQKVKRVWRRAKMLGIDLSGYLTLLFHLKMSGQLIYDGRERFIGGHPTADMKGQMPNKATRVIFEFGDRSKLYFNDQRRFGWVKVVDSKKLSDKNGLLGSLGPEPLEGSFSWQVLKNNLKRHQKMPIKVALMDQGVVAGLGNIYVNEVCFNAGLDPRTSVKDLTDDHFKKLYKGVVKALMNGIKYGGSTLAYFVDAEGNRGYFLDYAYVYGRGGMKCKKCQGIIIKFQLGGRGTYYCPKCQR